MKWYSTIVYALGISFAVALALYPKHAPAQQHPPAEMGTGIVCDEAAQVARYLRSKEGDGTLAKINAESTHACAILNVAFFMGEKGETVTNSLGTWQITKILIFGIDVGQGIQSVEPMVQWSAFAIEERGA